MIWPNERNEMTVYEWDDKDVLQAAYSGTQRAFVRLFVCSFVRPSVRKYVRPSFCFFLCTSVRSLGRTIVPPTFLNVQFLNFRSGGIHGMFLRMPECNYFVKSRLNRILRGDEVVETYSAPHTV